MFKEKTSFQFLDPTAFGVEAEFILGKHSGKRLRTHIATEANCDESAVLELQRRLVEEGEESLEEKFANTIKFLQQEAFKGVRRDRAVEILRQKNKDNT